MKSAIAILTIITISCTISSHSSSAQANESNKSIADLAHQLLSLEVEALNSNELQDHIIQVAFEEELPKHRKSALSWWASDKVIKLDSIEKEMILDLIEMEIQPLEIVTTKLSTEAQQIIAESNQTTESAYKFNMSKLSIDIEKKVCLTMMGTHFRGKSGGLVYAGQEEIVIYEKVAEKWQVRKRIIIIEY